jgi:hypothetical protein
MPQISALRMEIDRQETPGGRSLTQMRKAADANVATYFKTNIMFTAQPDRQIAATMQWNEDTGRKIDEYVKAGQPEKVRLMFQMNTPESVIKPEYLQTYVNSTPAQGVAQGAAAVKQGAQAPLAQSPAQPKTEAEYNALPPGSVYLDPTGKQRQKPGQAPAAAAPVAPGQPSTAAMTGDAPEAAAAPVPGPQMSEQGTAAAAQQLGAAEAKAGRRRCVAVATGTPPWVSPTTPFSCPMIQAGPSQRFCPEPCFLW